ACLSPGATERQLVGRTVYRGLLLEYWVGADRQGSGSHAAGRWRDRLHRACVQGCASGQRPVSGEHTCDERAGMRGAGGYEAGPSFAPELLADTLIVSPDGSARSWCVELDAA